MTNWKLMGIAAMALLVGAIVSSQSAKADVEVFVDEGIVTPYADPLPYGVYKATYYRRYHYDYGRYWWYYDPYAYEGGYYGYHPRRFRPYYYKFKRYGHRHHRRHHHRHGCRKRVRCYYGY